MKKATKKRIKRYKKAFELLCNGNSPKESLLKKYIEDNTNEYVVELQTFCCEHKSLKWVMGINVLDAIDSLAKNPE